MRAVGANVCDFGAGEPDFDTPDNIKQAAARAMRAGRTKYTAAGGIREIQRAIIDFYQRDFRHRVSTERSDGDRRWQAGDFQCRRDLLNPGDEALIPKPYWVTFPEVVVFAGGKPVFIETEETDFVLNCRTGRTSDHAAHKTADPELAFESFRPCAAASSSFAASWN